MVGIVIATHGPLAGSLVESVGLIMGHTSDIHHLGLFHGDDIDMFTTRLKETIVKADQGVGVLVFADMYGGSPSNSVALAAHELKGTQKIECVLGVNLPMLLETVAMRAYMDLDSLTQHVLDAGKDSVDRLANRLLGD